jgi:hypothetical protein
MTQGPGCPWADQIFDAFFTTKPQGSGMGLAISTPVLLGEGEHLFGGLDLPKLGYVHGKTAPGDGALHVVIRKM